MVKDAGFTDIYYRVIQRPTNDWPKDPKMKDIGMVRFFGRHGLAALTVLQFTNANYMEGLEAFTMALFTRIHGWQPEEVQVLLSQIRTEWRKRKIHGWQKGCVLLTIAFSCCSLTASRVRIYAQKPLEPS